MIRRCGIVTTNRNFAERIINTLKRIEVNKSNKVVKYINSATELMCIFENGTIIKWIPSNTKARGDRFTEVYVDIKTCNFDELTTVIMPKMLVPKESIYLISDRMSNNKELTLNELIDHLKKFAVVYGGDVSVGIPLETGAIVGAENVSFEDGLVTIY